MEAPRDEKETWVGRGGGVQGECNGTKRVKERESWNGQGGCCWPKWAICVCLRVCLRGYGKYMSGPIIPASLTSHGTLARWGQEGTQVSSCYSSTQTTHRVQPPSLMQTHPDLLSILQKNRDTMSCSTFTQTQLWKSREFQMQLVDIEIVLPHFSAVRPFL